VLCLGGNIVLTEREQAYHEMMVHPAMLMHEKPLQICCIGGGDGTCLKEVLKHRTVEKIVIVEIDQLVQETIKNYFPRYAAGFDDRRTELVIDDGYHFLKSNDRMFDIILVDSFDPGGPVQSLETDDFHRIVSTRLNKGGIAVFQTDSPIIRSNFLRTTIQSVSPFFSELRPYVCSIQSFPDGICSFLACANEKGLLHRFDETRYAPIAQQCEYYNNEVHTGAFMLPQYLKNALNG
jgi:spermidine synthase